MDAYGNTWGKHMQTLLNHFGLACMYACVDSFHKSGKLHVPSTALRSFSRPWPCASGKACAGGHSWAQMAKAGRCWRIEADEDRSDSF